MDLEKFPASKVRQLAKKMESSKATVCHIKQVAGDPEVAQINLMRQQCTEILWRKHKKRKPFAKPKQSSHKNAVQKNHKHQITTRRALILEMCTRIKIGVQSVEIPPMWKDFSALQRNSNVKLTIHLDILPVFCYQKSKHTSSLEDQRQLTTSRNSVCTRESHMQTL